MGDIVQSLLEPITGRKPKLPPLPKVDPAKVQAQAIAENQAALPGAQQLASDVNKFNLNEQLSLLTKALDFLGAGTADTVKGTIASQLRGEVPQDVQRQLLRQTVSGAFGRGYGGGSRIASNDYLRNFGLTSMDIQQRGLGNSQMFAPRNPQYDATSMFYTPQQRLQFAIGERDAEFNNAWMSEQIAAAPSPLGQFIQNVVYAVAGTAGRTFGVAGGGGGGGGGFGGGAGGLGGGGGGSGSASYIPSYSGGGGSNMSYA